ncbi:MAG: carbamoyltransferase HypF [Magnetococcales bacterium]|nr:carbamoyltransferase HypF [Magnetococcales bacterium]
MAAADLQAWRLVVTGRVQGVGFRPFVYQLAQKRGLTGWVRNTAGRVEIAVQGEPDAVERFRAELVNQAPPLARPRLEEATPIAPLATTGFVIRESEAGSPRQAGVPPDRFVCDDCLAEMAEVGGRRHRYPFINCTGCGPRYTIIRSLPYDRPHTAMAGFPLCPDCLREYRNPADRRFHAQPLACPLCGPRLLFVDAAGNAHRDAALEKTVAALQQGLIVGLKGIGGYHLTCLANDDEAVSRLRRLKPRPRKPLALMLPWQGDAGPEWLHRLACPTPAEEALLTDATRPIVLVKRREGAPLSRHIAPDLEEIGLMLPYSPLHHLLLQSLGQPVVATSGNVSGEPVLIDAEQAQTRLGHVAQAWLHHDRPILRPADDPVYRCLGGSPRPLRLGRGVAPVELTLPRPLPRPLLAVGGQMKNSVALAWDRRVVLSPHIGDLDTVRGMEVFVQVGEALQQLYGVTAQELVCDAHGGYSASRWARDSGLPVRRVGHHAAHASALLGENDPDREAMVFTWDGVGLGPDRTLWGGEALVGRPGSWRRRATFRAFRPPGGDRAAREPWRSLTALLWECGRPSLLPEDEAQRAMLHAAWKQGLNATATSAVGRLFDAAAARIVGLTETSYEGQAPMTLEAAACGTGRAVPLPLQRDDRGLWVTDWQPWLEGVMQPVADPGAAAADFHATLAMALLEQARVLRREGGGERVGLAGGVFQNRRLTERVQALLEAEGFTLLLCRQVPCNDGGLAYGQVIEALG